MDSELRNKFMAGAAAAHQRLIQLIRDYGAIETILPAMSEIRRSPADNALFERAMSKDYKLLLGRSPKLENFEINIFEAAFLRLMNDARTHPGAIQVYVDELLGLKAVAQPLKPQILRDAVRVRTMFMNMAVESSQPLPAPTCNNPQFMIPHTNSGMQLLSNLKSRSGHSSIRLSPLFGSHDDHNMHGNHNIDNQRPDDGLSYLESSNFPSPIEEEPTIPTLKGYISNSSAVQEDDPMLASFLSRYDVAKHVFDNTSMESVGDLTVADELRNAAQQCIQYILEIKPDDHRLSDLYKAMDNASRVM